MSVVPDPPNKAAPVEITMRVTTKYADTMHNDCTVALTTAGVLGETYLDIDSSQAIGGLLQDLDTLPTQVHPDFNQVVALEASLPFNEKKYRKDFGIPRLFGESTYTTLERTWARPTLEVNGMLSGFTGEGAKTVLPAVAMAKISMRLVPNQDPNKIAGLFQKYVEENAPKTVELKVTRRISSTRTGDSSTVIVR